MHKGFVARLALVAASLALTAPLTAGVGDLLVAPTRLGLNGGRGTEVILKNIGSDTATYRISAELRRMNPDGSLVEVADPTANEKTAQDMVLFAPRKVILPPNQPQSIRVSARAPAGLADGEYRVHLLFRAIPDPTPATQAQEVKGIAFKLIPIYGVTIPLRQSRGEVGHRGCPARDRSWPRGDHARPVAPGRPFDLRRNPRASRRGQGTDRRAKGRRGLPGARHAPRGRAHGRRLQGPDCRSGDRPVLRNGRQRLDPRRRNQRGPALSGRIGKSPSRWARFAP